MSTSHQDLLGHMLLLNTNRKSHESSNVPLDLILGYTERSSSRLLVF